MRRRSRAIGRGTTLIEALISTSVLIVGIVGAFQGIVFASQQNLLLCVSSFNRRAAALYRRLGYRTVGRLRDYVVAGHDEILRDPRGIPAGADQPQHFELALAEQVDRRLGRPMPTPGALEWNGARVEGGRVGNRLGEHRR